MSKGGAMPGAGRPKGSLSEEGRLKAEFKRLLVQEVLKQKGPIIKILVDKAVKGNLAALKEILDRLVGKPKETIDLKSEELSAIAQLLRTAAQKK